MKYVWLAITAGWFVFMTFLSHQGGSDTAEMSMKLAEFLGSAEWNGRLRQGAHVFVFLVLAVLVLVTLRVWKKKWQWGLLVFAWCVVDEATKPLIVGRHFAWFDVGLNGIGTGMGLALGCVIRLMKMK